MGGPNVGARMIELIIASFRGGLVAGKGDSIVQIFLVVIIRGGCTSLVSFPIK